LNIINSRYQLATQRRRVSCLVAHQYLKTHDLLLIIDQSSFINDHLSSITHYPLPITHYPLPITHYPYHASLWISTVVFVSAVTTGFYRAIFPTKQN